MMPSSFTSRTLRRIRNLWDALFGSLRESEDIFVGKLARQYRCELANAEGEFTCPKTFDEYFKNKAGDALPGPDYLYALEVLLLARAEPQDLRLRNAGLRDMLTHLLTPESYAALSAQFLSLSEASHEAILQEAKYLAARVHRRYGSVPTVEKLRAHLAGAIFTVFAVVALLMIGINVLIHHVSIDLFFRSAMTSAVMASGALGAALSTVVRLYTIDPRHEPGNTWLSIESGKGTILIAPLLGMAFALIFLLLVRGNLLSGDLFPDFNNGDFSRATSFTSLLVSGPAPALRDFAKLLVWSFMSGWAERMVPDVLDRLAPQARTVGK